MSSQGKIKIPGSRFRQYVEAVLPSVVMKFIHDNSISFAKEQQYLKLIENIEDGVVLFDLSFRHVFANKSYIDSLGFTEEEYYAQKPFERIHPEDILIFKEKMDELYKSSKSSVEFRFLHKNGSWVTFSAKGILNKDTGGNPTGFFIICRDITEEKKAVNALRESERRYRDLINNISAGVAVFQAVNNGEDFIFLDINPAVESLENINRNEIIGKSVIKIFPVVKRSGLFEVFQQVWQSGEAQHHQVSWQEGNRLAGWRENFIYKLQSGELVLVYEDITKRKQAEEEKEILLAEVNRANKELESIVSITSHDLRSPLVNIQGFVRYLDSYYSQLSEILNSEDIYKSVNYESLRKILKEEIPSAMHFIKTSTIKMDTLITSLLKYSRAGRIPLNNQIISMMSMFDFIKASFNYQIESAKAKIEILELPDCWGDNIQINQVFSNLIDNAIKYRDPNRELIIKISGHRKHNRSIYMVEDNGIGIADSDNEKIWELFGRINPHTALGEGIGLPLVKRIIERHNGKIRLESTVGKGTTFFIDLPAKM